MVRALAFASLFGLLLAIGLQTSFDALMAALRRVRLGALVLGNFLLIPVLATALIIYTGLEQSPSRALIFLACAPFAPVVPLFVRMAHGHQALATGLTALFPAFSAVLTPCAVTLSFWLLQDGGNATPSPLMILELLAASITLPLMLGIGVCERFPRLSHRIQKPMEWISEAIGVVSLIYLASLEAGHLAAFRIDDAWPYVLFYEASFAIGLTLGQGPFSDRLVMGFGTANRNIGLAILLAAALADDRSLLGELLSQSLLMLAVGLIHVALVRTFLIFGRFGRCIGSDKPAGG
jgi:BASS family bile acid:Na+ symporter